MEKSQKGNCWHAIGQWDPYQHSESEEALLPSAREALELVLKASEEGAGAEEPDKKGGGTSTIRGATSLCIVPGYRFRLCDALVTNFHQPDSTLMMLVAALVDKNPLPPNETGLETGGERLAYSLDGTRLVVWTDQQVVVYATQ